MKKILISAAVVAAAVAALRRFAPAIHQRAVSKCHQMMGTCGDMLSQHAGSPAGTACGDTATRGSGQTEAASASRQKQPAD